MRNPINTSLVYICLAKYLIVSPTASSPENERENRNFLRSPNVNIKEDTIVRNIGQPGRELGGCVPNFYADGQCDMSNCSADCTWDGGDCKPSQCNGYSSSGSGNANPATTSGQTDDYYSNKGNTGSSAPPPLNKAACRSAGGKPRKVNDGYCDQSNNIAACNYDGSDCKNNSNSNQQGSTQQATTSTANAAPPSNGGGSTGQYWTDLHNQVRKYYQGKYGYSFVNVVWSNDLAQSSQGYANVLAASPCDQYDHDPNNPYGENLAVMWEANDPSGENSRIKRVMDAWTYDEEIKNTALPWQDGSGKLNLSR